MKTGRQFVSTRQRVVVLTFPTAEDAERWDAEPTLLPAGVERSSYVGVPSHPEA